MNTFRPVFIWTLTLMSGAMSQLGCRVASSSETSSANLYKGEGRSDDQAAFGGTSRLQTKTAATAVPATCPAGLKIIGGKVVEEGELVAGATAKIWIKNQRICSGTVIGPGHIITAAHCFKDVASIDQLRLGFGVSGDVQDDIKVKSFLVHPSFKGVVEVQTFKDQPLHDVAIIAFEGSPHETLRPVTIAQPDNIYPTMPVIVAGYGAYGSSDKTRRDLSQVNIELASIRPDLNELQLKTGEAKGACFGDSGGPTFIIGEKLQCLLLLGSTTGPGRNTDYTCESGGGTLMDLTRYSNWIGCSFSQVGSPLPDFDDSQCRAD